MFRDVSRALSGPASGASRLEIGCLVGRRVATRYAKSALTKERTNWPLWRPRGQRELLSTKNSSIECHSTADMVAPAREAGCDGNMKHFPRQQRSPGWPARP